MITDLIAIIADGSQGLAVGPAMAPRIQTIRLPRLEVGTLRLKVYRQNGALYDLTGCTVALSLRRALADVTPLFTREATVTGFGTCTITIAEEDTAGLFERKAYLYDVHLTMPGGARYQIIPASYFRIDQIVGRPGETPGPAATDPGGTAPSGPRGLPGAQILHGEGAPGPGDGNDGDSWIDDLNQRLYGPKAAGVWPDNYLTLRGPPGVDGIQGIDGAGLLDGFEFVGPGTLDLAVGHHMMSEAGEYTLPNGTVEDECHTLYNSSPSEAGVVVSAEAVAPNTGYSQPFTFTPAPGRAVLLQWKGTPTNAWIIKSDALNKADAFRFGMLSYESDATLNPSTGHHHFTGGASFYLENPPVGPNGSQQPFAITLRNTSGVAVAITKQGDEGPESFITLQNNQFALVQWSRYDTNDYRWIVKFLTSDAAEASDAEPQPLGTANAGALVPYSRGDHAHAHGDQAGGSLHALATAGGDAGFMSGAMATQLADLVSADFGAQIATVATDLGTLTATVAGISGSYVPNTRTITAGGGLTGTGDLSANRTFAVGQNADNSIVVNADDIQLSPTLQTAISTNTSNIAANTAALATNTTAVAALGEPAYIVQQAHAAVPNAQALSALATGFARVTGTTGVVSTQATMATEDIADNAITYAKLQTVVARSVLGNATNTTATVTAITGTGAGTFLRDSGTALAFAALTNADLDDVIAGGSFTNANITVNSKGRITSASNGSGGGGAIAITNNVIPIGNGTTIVDSTLTIASNVVAHTVAAAGTTSGILASNTGNTAGTHATLEARVGGTSAGSPKLILGITGGTSWTMMANNATNDQLEFYAAATLAGTVHTTGGWLFPKLGAAGSPTAFGDRLNSSTGAANQVEIGNTTGSSHLRIGQGGSNNIGFGWTYNATASAAVGFLNTYGYANRLDIDAQEVRLQSNVNGGVAFFAAGVYGAAAKVIYVGNGSTPSSSPTAGFNLYSESGVAKIRGADGAITTFGAAAASHTLGNAGADVSWLVNNSSNTASASATLEARVAGTTADDPRFDLTITGGRSWRLRNRNSATDNFELYDVTNAVVRLSVNSVGLAVNAASATVPLFVRATDGLAAAVRIQGTGIQHVTAWDTNQASFDHICFGYNTAGTLHGLNKAGLLALVEGDVSGTHANCSAMLFGSLGAKRVYLSSNSVARLSIGTEGNIALNPTITSGAGATPFGGGVKVISVGVATTEPTSAPTDGNVLMWSFGSQLKAWVPGGVAPVVLAG